MKGARDARISPTGFRVSLDCFPVPGLVDREVAQPDVRGVHRVFDAVHGVLIAYVAMTSSSPRALDRELKKGSAELIVLSIVETGARHGYEIGKLIETRSGGALKFHVASLYPLLYRLEERGWLQGRWVEKAGERRRRFYSLTAEGRRVLARQRDTWKNFVHAMGLITGADHA